MRLKVKSSITRQFLFDILFIPISFADFKKSVNKKAPHRQDKPRDVYSKR